MRRYTLEQIKVLETKEALQCDDVKSYGTQCHWENSELKCYDCRVLLSRMTEADGAPYDNQVIVQELKGGTWVTVDEYEAMPKLYKDIEEIKTANKMQNNGRWFATGFNSRPSSKIYPGVYTTYFIDSAIEEAGKDGCKREYNVCKVNDGIVKYVERHLTSYKAHNIAKELAAKENAEYTQKLARLGLETELDQFSLRLGRVCLLPE